MKTIIGASSSISKILHFAKFPALVVLILFCIGIGGTERPKTTLPPARIDVVTAAPALDLRSEVETLNFHRVGSNQVLNCADGFGRSEVHFEKPAADIGGNQTPRSGQVQNGTFRFSAPDYEIGGQSSPRSDPRPYDNWSENYKS